jgi:hypothetical protein
LHSIILNLVMKNEKFSVLKIPAIHKTPKN